MNRTALLSALLTKRGVILALVVGVAALGAGFGFLPGLLDGPNDAGPSTPETTHRSDAAGETTAERSGDAATTQQTDSGTPPATVTPDAEESISESDETAERTRTGEAGTTGDSDAVDSDDSDSTSSDADRFDPSDTPDDGHTDDSRTDDRRTDDRTTADRTDDEPAEVGVVAESNATASSLDGYPSRSLRLNAVVNPPNTARTAGGA